MTKPNRYFSRPPLPEFQIARLKFQGKGRRREAPARRRRLAGEKVMYPAAVTTFSKKNRLHETNFNLNASAAHSNFSAMAQRERGIEKNAVFSNTSSEKQPETSCSIADQSHYLSVSEVKLSETLPQVSSPFEIGSCKEKKKTYGLEDTDETDLDYSDTDTDFFSYRTDVCRGSDQDDSLQEYFSAEEQGYDGHSSLERCFSSTESKCITCPSNGPSDNKVNQAVDATSDFRCCFTTSQATSVEAPVVSRAQNTVITMMSRGRPKEWLTGSFRSIGCNTDWSCISNYMEMSSSQLANADSLEDCIKGWKSETEEPLERKRNTKGNLSEIPNRQIPVSQEINEQLPSCCKEILQRALKAEMQVLRIRFQMYQQHCWQTCKSLSEKRTFGNNREPEKSVSQVSLAQSTEPSSHPSVTSEISVSENSDPQVSPSYKNSGEKKSSPVENSSSYSQEDSENWFDATGNLITGTPEETKMKSKSLYYVQIDGLSPLVSEVDLWLCFQKYNVSEISISDCSANIRYASLSFTTAHDAKLAIKEMSEKEIGGKAIKLKFLKSIEEKRTKDCPNWVQQGNETYSTPCGSKKNTEHKKNLNELSEGPVSSLAPLKMSASADVLNICSDSLKLSLPVFSKRNVTKTTSHSSKSPFHVSAPCKVHSSDLQTFKQAARNALLEIEEDITEDCFPLGLVVDTPNPPTAFIPQNTLNLRSFRKVVKKLEDLHPNINRNSILDALLEVKENKGSLTGLSLSTIVQMTSSLLIKKFPPKSEEDEKNFTRK